MRGLVIWNTYAQTLVIKRLGIVELCLADSNNFVFCFASLTVQRCFVLFASAKVRQFLQCHKDIGVSGGNPKDELIDIFFLIEKKRNLFGFLLTYSFLCRRNMLNYARENTSRGGIANYYQFSRVADVQEGK